MLSLDEIVSKLKEIVGPRFVSTNPIDKINYQHTLAYGAYRALPDVIVRVESTQDGRHSVSDILRFANENKIPIITKGGVGMGISSPLKSGILLDMLGMDKILVTKGGIGYGMTRYGWIADLVIGLEVVLASGETIRLGALANKETDFGPFQKWIHLPDLLGLFTLSAGSMGIISKVCLRALEGRRDWLHDYCYTFRRDQLDQVQESMLQLVKGEVVYDIHFTDRWQYYWPMEEGLYDKAKIPEDAWFFLKTLLFARDEEELSYKEKRMRRIYTEQGGVTRRLSANAAFGMPSILPNTIATSPATWP